MTDYFFGDIESYGVEQRWSMPPREFFRLGQYAINDGPVRLTTDYDEFMTRMEESDHIVFHNGHSFDWSVLYGKDSIRPLELALEGRLTDTMCLASLVKPAPFKFTTRNGHTFFDGSKPEKAMKWLSLDNLAFQYGIEGKMGDLTEIAKRYNPEKTPKKELDYGLIPLDDEEFLAYAEQDVIVLRDVYLRLIKDAKSQQFSRDYHRREQIVWAINAQISRNGIKVDTETAQARVDELKTRRDEIMDWLVRDFDMPTDSKQPWKSAKGKGAIIKAFESYGIVPEGNDTWPRTPAGAPSFSGDTMKAISEGTEAQALGEALAELQGQRSLAQLALDSTWEDGRVHPEITTLQRSGRTSITRPGLTVWSARAGGGEEKKYFVADPGHKMVEMDYSAADARAVAALSGDPEFVKRFEPGVDAHDLTGEIFFGPERYYANREELRPIAKMGGHAMAYRVGARKLAASLDVTVQEAKGFIDAYQKAYPWVKLWQDTVTDEGEGGFVTNSWGRRMVVDPDRSFTQSSALYGQSTTREILYDGLVAIAFDRPDVLRWLSTPVHDAVVWNIPEGELDWAVPYITGKMEKTFDPGTKMSQKITFTMSAGQPADNWRDAAHD